MKDSSKSEDWLAFLFYTLDAVLAPSPRRILQTFEEWDYENRFRPQLRRLQRAKLLERHGHGAQASYRLTPQGRLEACGGVDPVARWQRAWDGRWRLLLFDLPSRDARLRLRLWRWLRDQRFGYLQNSVWLSPDPLDDSLLPLRHLRLTPESFVVLESRPAPPDSDADLAKSAWDFAAVNRHYEEVMELAARGLELARASNPKPAQFRAWLAAERRAWLTAVESDPLLPAVLLPAGYLGQEAWKQRQAAFTALAQRGDISPRRISAH
jgi:phenylacetic acid degradation operon negative regulatory protein